VIGLKQLGLVDEAGCFSPSRKRDPRKVALASVVKARTSVCNEWLAIRLEMGHNRSVSRLVRQGNNDDKIKKPCVKFTKLLLCKRTLSIPLQIASPKSTILNRKSPISISRSSSSPPRPSNPPATYASKTQDQNLRLLGRVSAAQRMDRL